MTDFMMPFEETCAKTKATPELPLVRAFLSLNPNFAMIAQLGEAQTKIRRQLSLLEKEGLRVTWTKPTQFHLTLIFLGLIPRLQLPPLLARLKSVASGCTPLDLMVGGFGSFPVVKNPRVLWLGVTPNPALSLLQDTAEQAVAESVGLNGREKSYPHVTLGRVRTGIPRTSQITAVLNQLTEEFADLQILWKSKTLTLMESRDTSTGVEYSSLATLSLDGGG